MGSHCVISPQSVSTVYSLITWWEWGDVVQSRPWLCFHPGTLHYSASIQAWNSCGIWAATASFNCTLFNWPLTNEWRLSHRSKLKTNRTSRTSPAWWLWPGPTPPPSPMSSPSTISASRRSATTTRLTCKMFHATSIITCDTFDGWHHCRSSEAKTLATFTSEIQVKLLFLSSWNESWPLGKVPEVEKGYRSGLHYTTKLPRNFFLFFSTFIYPWGPR